MEQSSLTKFIKNIREIWGPLGSSLVMKSQMLIEELANTSDSEPWLVNLKKNLTEGRELYRDPEHGFILLAHTEVKGLYRTPHDHGKGWVIYSVQSGEMEMSTYGRAQNAAGEFDLVCRETYRVNKGESKVYLPGDIHSTKCISNSVLMFRLASCDLKSELQAGRMHRYEDQK